VKTIYLVGESLPMKKGTAHEALHADLVAFDSRHGVFPNLVAKPLLSALYFLNKEGGEIKPLLDQLDPLMTHTDPQRRFNVFVQKASKDAFRVDPGLGEWLSGFDPAEHLWLVFGVQTNFGLLGYMSGRFRTGVKYQKGDIWKFATQFVAAALKHSPRPDWLPASRPTQRTACLGILHRLCTDADEERAEAVLRWSLKEVRAGDAVVEQTVRRLRSMVPLLHNEAYQDRYEIGYNQAHFVSCQAVGSGGGTPPQLYWRVMGKAIAGRLRANSVNR
jgi:hypothetical protein